MKDETVLLLGTIGFLFVIWGVMAGNGLGLIIGAVLIIYLGAQR